MPRKLTKSDPDETASIRVEVPGWMKNGVIDILDGQGKGLSDWIKDQMRALLDEHQPSRGKKRER